MSKLDISITFPAWGERLKAAEGRINQFIAAGIQTNRGMMFDQEGGFNGHEKWAPLKYRDGQILSLTGTLRKSISPSSGGKQLGIAGPGGFVEQKGDLIKKTTTVGTSIAYAAIHNYGGTVTIPENKNGFGKGILIPKHDVRIPRRNFDEWNESDAADLEAGLANLIGEILNGV